MDVFRSIWKHRCSIDVRSRRSSRAVIMKLIRVKKLDVSKKCPIAVGVASLTT